MQSGTYRRLNLPNVSFCTHGRVEGDCAACDEDDAYVESCGGIDKCLTCGRYKYGDQLNSMQSCANGCVNPNEY
jgi:hypothetical protein